MSLAPQASTIRPSTSVAPTGFKSIFDAALMSYQKLTKKDLLADPLVFKLQSCNSTSAILAVLQDQVRELDKSSSGDERLTKWLTPTVNVLCTFSAAISGGVSLVFSPASVIFAGISVFLLAAKDVAASKDVLAELFERIGFFFKRLDSYTEVTPTAAMTDIITEIMVEVLIIFAIATKELHRGSAKKFLRKLAGMTDLEDALKKLDRLTQEEARMALAEVLRITNSVRREVESTGDKVDQVKWNQLKQLLRAWLSPADPSKNHNIARKVQHKGTAVWFCEGVIVVKWKSSTGSLLWIHGKPGSGKSVICSSVIQDVMAVCESGLAVMAYFYFDFRDLGKQTCHDLLRSLVFQLSTCSSHCCDILHRVYEKHKDGTQQPSDDALKGCLKEMLRLLAPDQTFIILDALDECPDSSGIPSPRDEVLQLVKELVDLRLHGLYICATSRPEVDIRAVLQPLAFRSVSLHDESGQRTDISDYVRSVVDSSPSVAMRRWRTEDKKLVVETLTERADGMFRWVFCQLEALRHCFPSNLRQFLNKLPDTLDETYERMLRGINKAQADDAYRLLQCLTVAVRPLRVEELAELLAFDFQVSDSGGIPTLKKDWRWDDEEEAVLSTCSSLITIIQSGHSRVVQFSHFSVKEYLTSSRLAQSHRDVSRFYIDLEQAHMLLAQACLGTLLRLDEHAGDNVGKEFPLANYAAQHWVEHAQFENVSTHLWDGMVDLFDLSKPHFAAWLRVHDLDEAWPEFSPRKPGGGSPLYYASFCGFYDLAEHLITKHPEHVNASGGLNVAPLPAALYKRHFPVASLLRKHSALVDVRGDQGWNPLHAASYFGHVDIIRWLLDHGADVNARVDLLWTPLHLAAAKLHLEATQVLLEYDADVNSQNNLDRTSLHEVSFRSSQGKGVHVDIVRRLLEHGADTNIRDFSLSTPLHLASFNGSLEVSGLLLSFGAKVDEKNKVGKTTFQVASERGHTEMTKLLLEHGGDGAVPWS